MLFSKTLHRKHFTSVMLSSREQPLEFWNDLFTLNQEFGNRPVSPTICFYRVAVKLRRTPYIIQPQISTAHTSAGERQRERQVMKL